MINRFGKRSRMVWLGAGLLILADTVLSFGESRYPYDRIHSVITASVVTKIRAIIDAGSKTGRNLARFIKVGDSITKSDPESHTQPNSPFLCQFICPEYTEDANAWDFRRNLDVYKDELTPALLFYLADTMADGTSSFNRPSAAASVGMYADWAVSGNPSPLRKEIDSVNPQFAVIMYGANDAGGYGTMHTVLSTYIGSVRKIVDSCIASGVVPVLTATCPRLDNMEYTLAMSYLVRCLAQQYQIPFIDYYRAMMPLPGYGLRDDGVHPNYFDYNKSCWLTSEGLSYGYNMRNLVTLQALSKMHQIATTSITSIDADPPALDGNGTEANPFAIDAIPFLDVQFTSETLTDVSYVLTLSEQTKIRMFVTSQDSADISLTVVNSRNESVAVSANEPMIDQTLDAGIYTITLKAAGSHYGAYQFVLYNKDDDGMPEGETGAHSGSFKSVFKGTDFIIHRNSNNVVVTTPEPGSLSILDVMGRCVFAEKISSYNGITHWTAQSSGMYILKYTHNKSTMIRNICVQ